MDLRYQRLLYFIRLSRQTRTGIGKYEAWHPHWRERRPRADRYKNIDRTTIRRPARP